MTTEEFIKKTARYRIHERMLAIKGPVTKNQYVNILCDLADEYGVSLQHLVNTIYPEYKKRAINE